MTTTSKACWLIFLVAAVVYAASSLPQLVRELPASFMIAGTVLMFVLHISGCVLAFTSVASLLNKSNDRLQRMMLDGINSLSGLLLFQGTAILMNDRVKHVVMEYLAG